MTDTPQLLLVHHLKALKLPTFLREHDKLARQCAAEGVDHTRYLLRLAEVELIERERRMVERRIKEAKFPAVKSLDSFDFLALPSLNKALVLELARSEYVARRENIIAVGNSGTGKTHLATGLCVAACQQKKRCRFVTAAGLVNELVEAQHHNLLGRALQRWSRYDLIILDEVGYVPFAAVGAELLFQVISERAERATLILTTTLPFSEWTQVFPRARLCKALLDRVTDRAHIIETGTDSYRFKRTVEKKKRNH